METKDIIIDKASWITKRRTDPPLTEEDRKIEYFRFETIIKFLQDNELTTKIILPNGQKADDETEIKISDLTEKGILLIKKTYDKWLKKIDRAKDKIKAINDLSLFEKELPELK